MDPLDEDAPAVAAVAADAADLLGAATSASVGYPGLGGVRDAEEVVQELARLADQLQEAAAHLEEYLNDQLHQRQLRSAEGSSQPVSHPVRVARAALSEVQDSALAMVQALNIAEQAMLEVRTSTSL